MIGHAKSWEFRHRVAILLSVQIVWLLAHGGVSHSPPWLMWLGACVGLAGAWLRVLAARDFRNAIMVSRKFQTSQLVSAGLYAHVRNPLYAGSLGFLTGVGLMIHPWTWVLFTAFNWWRYQRIILSEEAQLHAHHGEFFRNYCASTGRWVPSDWQPNPLNIFRITGSALLANMLFVGGALGFLMAAYTLHIGWGTIGEGVGGIITGFYLLAARRTETTPT